MATYGRKRRGLLSPFLVFQDGAEPRTKLSGYSRLLSRSTSRIDVGEKSPATRATFGDASVDELASASTPRTPRSVRRGMDAISVKSQQTREGRSRPSTSASTKLTATPQDKPLPPLPPPPPSSPSKMPLHKSRSSKLPLAEKPANVGLGSKLAKKKSPSKTREKLTISAPILQKDRRPATAPSVDAPDPGLTALPRSPLPRSQSAMHFGKYFNPNHSRAPRMSTQDDLLSVSSDYGRADTHSTSRKVKAMSRAVDPHKGRQVLGKFRDAISDRLPGGFGARNKLTATFPVLTEEISATHFSGDENESEVEARVKRRMAEVKNFSNSPKVRDLTGSPKKPLLAHDSTKLSLDGSVRSSVASSRVGLNIAGIIIDSADDDPFSEDEAQPASNLSHTLPGFHFNFSTRNLPHLVQQQVPSAQSAGRVDEVTAFTIARNETSASGFSNLISGLRQHPNVMEFAEPPANMNATDAKGSERPSTPPDRSHSHKKREGFQFNQSPIRRTSSGMLQYAPERFESFNSFFGNYPLPALDNESMQMDVAICPTITIKRASDHSKRSSAEAGLSPAQAPKKSKRVSPEELLRSKMKRLSSGSQIDDVEAMATDVNSDPSRSTDTLVTAKTHFSHHATGFDTFGSMEGILALENGEEASWLLPGSGALSVRKPKTQRRVSAPYASAGRSAVGRMASASFPKMLDYLGNVGTGSGIGDEMESADELGADVMDHRVGWAC